jgi:signal transduction histidine kinase
LLAAYHEPRSEVDVAAVVRSATDDLRETRDCELTVEAPDSLPIRSHERLLERLVTELLENAVEHSDRETPRAAVTVEPTESGAVEIEVADDGPGIPEAEFERLFEGSETQLDHGTGVGLWVVRWAVDYLGGEIDFDSGTTGGSVVTVRLYGDRL